MSGCVGGGWEGGEQDSASTNPRRRISGMSPVEVCNKEFNPAQREVNPFLPSCKVISNPLELHKTVLGKVYLEALGHPRQSNSVICGGEP